MILPFNKLSKPNVNNTIYVCLIFKDNPFPRYIKHVATYICGLLVDILDLQLNILGLEYGSLIRPQLMTASISGVCWETLFTLQRSLIVHVDRNINNM